VSETPAVVVVDLILASWWLSTPIDGFVDFTCVFHGSAATAKTEQGYEANCSICSRFFLDRKTPSYIYLDRSQQYECLQIKRSYLMAMIQNLVNSLDVWIPQSLAGQIDVV
jgi:hypothetical protein